MNRRDFFRVGTAAALAARLPLLEFELEGILAVPTRKIFLPPRCGWSAQLWPGLYKHWSEVYGSCPEAWIDLYR